MHFTFVVHPLSPWTLRLFGVRTGQARVAVEPFQTQRRFAFERERVGPIARFERIQSDTGAVCSGQIIGIPTLADDLLEHQERAVEMMGHAIDALAPETDIVGLGAVCAVVGLRGQALARKLSMPVTTGNSLTCWAAAETTHLLMQSALPYTYFRPRILVMGLPGTVAAAILAVLARKGLPVEAYHPTWPKPLVRRLDRLEQATNTTIRRWKDLDLALRGKGIVVGAGSIGGELVDANIRPGTLIVDVAQPLDTSPAQRAREDLLIVEGELVSMPNAAMGDWMHGWTGIYNAIIGQGDNRIFACLAEPMLLALEERLESFSLGKILHAEKIEELGQIATRHGFGVRSLYSGHRQIDAESLDRFLRIPWLP